MEMLTRCLRRAVNVIVNCLFDIVIKRLIRSFCFESGFLVQFRTDSYVECTTKWTIGILRLCCTSREVVLNCFFKRSFKFFESIALIRDEIVDKFYSSIQAFIIKTYFNGAAIPIMFKILFHGTIPH